MTQNKYPLCEQLGLPIRSNMYSAFDFINAADLEAVLQKATVVYCEMGNTAWNKQMFPTDTHQALLLSPQPIKEKTTLEKIMDLCNSGRIGTVNEIKKLIEAENEKAK